MDVRQVLATLVTALFFAGCTLSGRSSSVSQNGNCKEFLSGGDQAIMLRTNWTFSDQPGGCRIEIREVMSEADCRYLRESISNRLVQASGPPTKSWSALEHSEAWPLIQEWDFDDGSRIYYRQEPWRQGSCSMTITLVARKA
jgi:hypothetical protein